MRVHGKSRKEARDRLDKVIDAVKAGVPRCGRAGVVNIARYTRRLTGDQPLHALVGGFRLSGPVFEPIIARVLDDLAALHPSVLVPAHCISRA